MENTGVTLSSPTTFHRRELVVQRYDSAEDLGKNNSKLHRDDRQLGEVPRYVHGTSSLQHHILFANPVRFAPSEPSPSLGPFFILRPPLTPCLFRIATRRFLSSELPRSK